MNFQVPAYYPEIPQEFNDYLREIDEVIVPECIEGDSVSLENQTSALRPLLAKIGDIYFDVYKSRKDVWEDAYYLAWCNADKPNTNDLETITLLTDLALQSVKELEWWER